MKIIKPKVELIDANINKDLDKIEKAGRICYNSKCNKETRDIFIKGLIKNQHFSVIEHSSITYKIICSRSCLAQLSRHRLISLSVQSQRYVDYTKEKNGNGNINFIIPEVFGSELIPYLNEIENKYNNLIKTGYKPEDARAILPNATATELYITMNFRELRHILKLRLDNHAQAEIKYIAYEMYRLFNKAYPNNPILFDIKIK